MGPTTSLNEHSRLHLPKACLPCAKVKARCELEAGNETCNRCLRLKRTCSRQSPGAHRRPKLESPDGPKSSDGSRSPAVFIDQVVRSDSEGDGILQAFRKQMEPQFPFVIINPNSHFKHLKTEKPLLSLAIVMVGLSHDQARQETVVRKIREIISRDLLMGGEQDLDLLQCLLVYVNWYHFHLHLGSQFCNFIHLIMAVLTELGLNKEASTNTHVSGFGRFGYFGSAGSVLNMGAPDGFVKRTLEERRAFLGCFFLTSVTSMCIRDIEPIRHSRYVDDCCTILLEAAEFPTDVSVVQLARLHGVAHKITHTFSYENLNNTGGFTADAIGAGVMVLEADLAQLKTSFPREGHQNALLSIHYHVVELFLYERAIDSRDQLTEIDVYPFARLRLLQGCLEATRLCLDAFHSIPDSRLFDIPYTSLTFLSHAIVVLSKLSLSRTKDWEDDILDFPGTIDNLIRKVNDATSTAKLLDKIVPRVFTMLPDTLRKVAAVHEAINATQPKPLIHGPQLPPTEIFGTYTDDQFLTNYAQSFPVLLNEDFWDHFTWS